MGKKEEYEEAMHLARASGPKNSKWAPPKPSKQKSPNGREQYTKRNFLGGETRSTGAAAKKASRKDKW